MELSVMRLRLFTLACLAFLPTATEAKPISYVGGTMVMVENDETGHSASIDYTFTPRLAGALYVKREIGGDDFTMVGPQANVLVKRWNMPDGQGNIFSMTGGGAAVRDGTAHFAAWSSILADYETRRIFTSYEVRLMYAQGIEKSVWQRARVGVAPYLANYDDLNTWFMVQVDHHPEKRHATAVTPLLRLFYKTFLVEGGVSTRGTVMFNLVQQF
jgi:hypothetical protein